MLRELKFPSVIAHGCAVTVIERAGSPNWPSLDVGFRPTVLLGLSGMSRPSANLPGQVSLGFVRPSAFARHADWRGAR